VEWEQRYELTSRVKQLRSLTKGNGASISLESTQIFSGIFDVLDNLIVEAEERTRAHDQLYDQVNDRDHSAQ